VLRAKLRSLDGIAITEHDRTCDLRSKHILVIPGIEISSREGHILGIGITTPVPPGLSSEETLERVRDLGGIAVIPHPYDLACSSVRPRSIRSRPDAIETINSSALFFHAASLLARQDANILSLPMVGASDSHIPETVGDSFTFVDAESRKVEDILEAVRRGRTTPRGGPTSLVNKLRKLYRQARRG